MRLLTVDLSRRRAINVLRGAATFIEGHRLQLAAYALRLLSAKLGQTALRERVPQSGGFLI